MSTENWGSMTGCILGSRKTSGVHVHGLKCAFSPWTCTVTQMDRKPDGFRPSEYRNRRDERPKRHQEVFDAFLKVRNTDGVSQPKTPPPSCLEAWLHLQGSCLGCPRSDNKG